MTARRTVAYLFVASLAGCTIPAGAPIGSTRLVLGRDPAGSPILTVPSCPDWQRSSREDFSNRVASNFGCADAVNFLGQLAVPGDAIAGRVIGSGDGLGAAQSVERYRTRKTAPLATGGGASGNSPAPSGGPS